MSFFMLFLSLSFATQPQLIALKAIDADRQSYQAWLSHNQKLTSNLSFIEASLSSEKINRKMTEAFFSAKANALRGHTKVAKEEFLAITEMALERSWEDAQQEVVFHSFLFLSEIADSPLEKKLWLKRAIGFLPWYSPKFNSYSMATQNLFKKTQQELKAQQIVWKPYERFSKFDTVLVNGNRFDIGPESEVILGQDQYRLTFIAHDIFPQTRLVQSGYLNSFGVPEEPIIDGSCEAPKANLSKFSGTQTSYVVFFNNQCIRKFDGQNWSNYHTPVQGGVLPMYNLTPNTLSSMNFSRKEQKEKRRWKWIGASMLAAAISYAIYDHNRPTEVRQIIVDPED
ncbi:MAG: hypothetical protein SGJ18_05585 [Pseudomonadota bacterium]|nr:hypothetical protein [Pseudomonadota bacterium]